MLEQHKIKVAPTDVEGQSDLAQTMIDWESFKRILDFEPVVDVFDGKLVNIPPVLTMEPK